MLNLTHISMKWLIKNNDIKLSIIQVDEALGLPIPDPKIFGACVASSTKYFLQLHFSYLHFTFRNVRRRKAKCCRGH